MSDFMITNDKLPFIAKKLKVKKGELQKFLPDFKDFYKNVTLQHLASLMRAMEIFVRERTKNKAFRIVWSQSNQAVASAVSLKWDEKYGIVTPATLHNKEQLRKLRVYVAHELGHLFFCTTNPENKGKKENQDMANIFGVFAMLERNFFYDKKAEKISHDSWENVVEDFIPFVPKR